MYRPRLFALVALVGVAVGIAFWLSRGASAEPPSADHRIVFLYVSGQGPQAKAWYDGAAPSGVLVQTALDTHTKQGYRFSAMASSGTPLSATPSVVADYVILLER